MSSSLPGLIELSQLVQFVCKSSLSNRSLYLFSFLFLFLLLSCFYFCKLGLINSFYLEGIARCMRTTLGRLPMYLNLIFNPEQFILVLTITILCENIDRYKCQWCIRSHTYCCNFIRGYEEKRQWCQHCLLAVILKV